VRYAVSRTVDAWGASTLTIDVDGRPLPLGRKVVAVGRNYHEHASEQHVEPPTVPLLFAKLPNSLIGDGDEIVWSPSVATLVDYEAELGVVIGSTTSRVSVAEAMASVFGYCNVNDVTARDLQKSEGQWLRGKSHDTFCPVGPVVVTSDEVPDPHALRITCTVNGEVRQDASTGEMIFSIPELISHISQAVTLLPGDLICTGTPGGVGMHRTPPQLLADGDEVVVEIEGLGRLVNRCRTFG
jgi:2-keto-4-pentenoate hydratase/2-oxohepta-3-ene-1,7-dioic acid hydratase in catechol pathway